MSDEQARCAIYLRLSRQTDESSSIDRQRRSCEAEVVTMGGTYNPATDLYVDDGASGWDLAAARPGFDALQANLGRYNRVIVWKLDRLCRSLRTFVEVADQFEKRGVALVSVHEKLDLSTPIGKLIATILAVFAEMESSNTSLRRRDAARLFAHTGRWDRSAPPYGFKTVPRIVDGAQEGWTLDVDEERAQWVRIMAQEVLAGRSLTATARLLNERDAPRRAGNASWCSSSIRSVLTNPVLIGQASYKGDALLTADGEPLTPYPALLERWDFDAIGQKLAANTFGRPPGRRHDEMLLSGLVRCGRCGKQMIAADRRRRYWCNAMDRHGPTMCATGHSANAADLEAFVKGAVSARLSSDFLNDAAEWLRQEQEMLNGSDPRHRRRTEISAQLDRLEADRAAGLYDAPAAQARFRNQHRALVAELGELDAASALASMSPLFSFLDRIRGDGFEAFWADPDADRRSLIGAVVDRILVQPPAKPGERLRPERVSIVWKDAPVPTTPEDEPAAAALAA